MSTNINTITVSTPECWLCGDDGVVEVPEDGYDKWRKGMYIQDALSTVPAEIREQLITGTHQICWDNTFKEKNA